MSHFIFTRQCPRSMATTQLDLLVRQQTRRGSPCSSSGAFLESSATLLLLARWVRDRGGAEWEVGAAVAGEKRRHELEDEVHLLRRNVGIPEVPQPRIDRAHAAADLSCPHRWVAQLCRVFLRLGHGTLQVLRGRLQ